MAMSVGTAIGYLDLDTSKFQSALKTASSQLKGFTDSSKSTGDRITSLSGLKVSLATLYIKSSFPNT